MGLWGELEFGASGVVRLGSVFGLLEGIAGIGTGTDFSAFGDVVVAV